MEPVLVAPVGGVVTLVGVVVSNLISRIALVPKLDELFRRVERRNWLMGRARWLEWGVASGKREVESLEERG